MMGEDVAERLTEEVLQELLDAPSLDEFIDAHEFPAVTLPEFLERMLEKKGLKRSRVVRMADLNETFGYQIFTGARNPSRDKVLQIAFAMALSLRETNRALMAAGASAPSIPNAVGTRLSSSASIRGARCKRSMRSCIAWGRTRSVSLSACPHVLV